MNFGIDDRLSRLRDRRMDSSNDAFRNQSFTESFEKRTQNKATKYALGAMQEVNRRSTEISKEEAVKVENALSQRLSKHGLTPQFRLQGSVPMNTHIRGVSDVDLLEVYTQYLRYDPGGVSANSYLGVSPGFSVAREVLNMRRITEDELDLHFPAATVDRAHPKSIQLSGGSFRRKVDVVPSHWFDSANYQLYKQEIYRGITIVDKFSGVTTDNYPFLFAHHIHQKALATNEGVRMAIRLLKNLKNDTEDTIKLSSYDIASLMFHCPVQQIMRATARDLLILSGTESWLSGLCGNRYHSEQLMTPDGTRRILDNPEKWTGLCLLSRNLTELSREVDQEIVGPYFSGYRDLGDVRKNLNESQVPLVPDF